MTWSKKLDAAGSNSALVTARLSGHYPVLVRLEVAADDWIELGFTLNQAGDLAHAINEAIAKAQGEEER